MRAQDVMTSPVITVHPDTPVRHVARLMAENRISGVPVVDASGSLIGIVTDGDLYRRAELGTEKRRSRWHRLFTPSDVEAAEYVEAHGQFARDVMTTEVIAVTPETTLVQIAEQFEKRGIRRVPVLADGIVVGIVSRANLVRALATAPLEAGGNQVTDRQIRDQVLGAFAEFQWSLKSPTNVIVRDGVLHLYGFVAFQEQADALRVAAQSVPGVRQVVDHTVRLFGDVFEDMKPKPAGVTVVGPPPND